MSPVGSVAVAVWIALLAFPTLLAIGWARGDLGGRSIVLFVLLFVIVWIGFPRLMPNGANFVTSAIAVIDIALVFAVFKGDVRLT